MDELTMVRDLGRETPEADAGRLAAGRAALMAEAGRRPRRKRIGYGLAAAGLAALSALPHAGRVARHRLGGFFRRCA